MALLPAFASERFGTHALGRDMGRLYAGRGIALLAGPPAATWAMAGPAGLAATACLLVATGAAGTVLLARVQRRGAG